MSYRKVTGSLFDSQRRRAKHQVSGVTREVAEWSFQMLTKFQIAVLSMKGFGGRGDRDVVWEVGVFSDGARVC